MTSSTVSCYGACALMKNSAEFIVNGSLPSLDMPKESVLRFIFQMLARNGGFVFGNAILMVLILFVLYKVFSNVD